MAEQPKQAFDPDATVAQPVAGEGPAIDPDATVALPISALDPEATVNGAAPPLEPDPDATFTGPLGRKPTDGDGTDPQAAFDPDATVSPGERVNLDPDAAVRVSGPIKKIRLNPFAPKSTPDAIQANLAALGGLNPLIALANPILSAVPQIRRTLKHPDAAGLRASLQDQIDSLSMSASFAEISDASTQTAVYALCALLDESAAATPWGGAWKDDGLLKAVCNESGGGAGFFTHLERISAAQDPEDADNADLLEFFYVCLALGFEGRYRGAEDGAQSLGEVRNDLYALIARRRPRPTELSEHWRSATAEAAAAPALQMAAEISARLAAQRAAGSSAETTLPPVTPSLLSRVPRRVVWSALAGVVGAMIAFYMLTLRLLDDETKTALADRVRTTPKRTVPAASSPVAVPAPAPATAPVALGAGAALAKALQGESVTVTEEAGRITLSLKLEAQFPVGGILPAVQLRPVFEKIATALNGVPGAIVVTGHADASPTRSVRWASNAELSAARARAVAQLMAPKLSTPGRLSSEGKGDAEPIAPGNTEADRARNRRITITVKPNP